MTTAAPPLTHAERLRNLRLRKDELVREQLELADKLLLTRRALDHAVAYEQTAQTKIARENHTQHTSRNAEIASALSFIDGEIIAAENAAVHERTHQALHLAHQAADHAGRWLDGADDDLASTVLSLRQGLDRIDVLTRHMRAAGLVGPSLPGMPTPTAELKRVIASALAPLDLPGLAVPHGECLTIAETLKVLRLGLPTPDPTIPAPTTE